MNTIDVVGIFKTVATVAELGDNKFLVKYGNHKQVVVTISEAQHSVQRTALTDAEMEAHLEEIHGMGERELEQHRRR